MNRLDPNKLSVEHRDNITPTSPIKPKKYTLTHSDMTGELFLTIAKNYAVDKITMLRDEVLLKKAQEKLFPLGFFRSYFYYFL